MTELFKLFALQSSKTLYINFQPCELFFLPRCDTCCCVSRPILRRRWMFIPFTTDAAFGLHIRDSCCHLWGMKIRGGRRWPLSTWDCLSLLHLASFFISWQQTCDSLCASAALRWSTRASACHCSFQTAHSPLKAQAMAIYRLCIDLCPGNVFRTSI